MSKGTFEMVNKWISDLVIIIREFYLGTFS